MATQAESSIVKDGDQVMIRKDKILKVLQVRKDRNVFIEKTKIALCKMIGQPYGTTFEVQKGGKPVIVNTTTSHDADCELDEEAGKDNRNVTDHKDNQAMSRDDLVELKKSGVSGEGIVEQLIEKSATFKEKTEFAQQKYIKKKKKKYIPLYTILKPSTRLLCEMYNNKGPTKICCMRTDSLAQILTHANVRPHNKMMVVESCVGLLLGAIMERMAGHGTLVQFYNGSAPIRQAVTALDFPQHYFKNLHGFPLEMVSTIRKQDSLKSSESKAQDLSMHSNTRLNSNLVSSNSESSGLAVAPLQPDQTLPENSNISRNGPQSTRQCTESTGNDLPLDLTTERDSEQTAKPIYQSDSKPICDVPTAQCQEKSGSQDENIRKGGSEETMLVDEDSVLEEEDVQEEGTTSTNHEDSEKWNAMFASGKGLKKKHLRTEEEKQQRRENRLKQIEETRMLIERADMDGLIVATRYHPTPIVMSLINYVLPARPIVVFCQYKEPLLDCYQKLRDHGGVLLIKLTETWLREYQVLRDRTHPKMQMSGTGGYLLTGMTVCTD